MKRNRVIPSLVFLIDQYFKHIVRTRLALHESFVHFGPFGITHFENTAGPFSIPISLSFLLLFHITTLAFVLFAMFRFRHYRNGLFWIFAGGISNLIDRIAFASTTDYFALPFGGFWNLADVMVLIGIVIILFTKPTSPHVQA